MEKQDLEQIRQIVREEFVTGFGQIWDDSIEPALTKLDKEISALSAKVTSHLELSDKRYLELKRKNVILVKWIKQLAEKTGVKLDLKELEDF